MTKKLHWTQTPEGKARMSAAQKKVWAGKKDKAEHFRQLAKMGAKVKRGPYKAKQTLTRDAVSVVINGWRITLGKDEVKIEHE